jgi:dihydroorotate dehydrogenase (fumarate)
MLRAAGPWRCLCANASPAFHLALDEYLEQVRRIRAAVAIPVIGSLNGITATGWLDYARLIQEAGANALELNTYFSDPSELLRLRWLAILSGQGRRLDLAATCGVHGPHDVVKAVMAGAHMVQLVSALLVHGPAHLRAVHDGVARTLDELGYASLAEMRGCMNLARCPDASAFERANYLRVLHSWHDGGTRSR